MAESDSVVWVVPSILETKQKTKRKEQLPRNSVKMKKMRPKPKGYHKLFIEKLTYKTCLCCVFFRSVSDSEKSFLTTFGKIRPIQFSCMDKNVWTSKSHNLKQSAQLFRYCLPHCVYFDELVQVIFILFALLQFCFHILRLPCFHKSVTPLSVKYPYAVDK